jgi:hypothetical protein
VILRNTIDPPAIIWQIREGLSQDSETMQAILHDARQHAGQPISRRWQSFLKEDIREVVHQHAERGWDGYDASPISAASASRALRLIDQLPENLEQPRIVPEPDGDIALEWNTGRGMLFSISVAGSQLIYAGKFGGNTRYGQERFFDELPSPIAETLLAYFRKA